MFHSIETHLALDRRQLMSGAAALGLAGSLTALPALAQSTPKKGGTLRLGMEGGSASDSLDPRTYADSIPISYSLMFWNQLVEIDAICTGAKPNRQPKASWSRSRTSKSWVRTKSRSP